MDDTVSIFQALSVWLVLWERLVCCWVYISWVRLTVSLLGPFTSNCVNFLHQRPLGGAFAVAKAFSFSLPIPPLLSLYSIVIEVHHMIEGSGYYD